MMLSTGSLFWHLSLLALDFTLSHGQYECVSKKNSLSKDNPPGSNFNLTHWFITLPDANASNISPINLTNGFIDNYFYTSQKDGSMTFYCPTDGGTTPNAHFPRSELQQLCNPPPNVPWNKTQHYNFYIDGTPGIYQMWETVRIDENITANGTVVAQIHGYEYHPLFLIFWWDFDGGTLQAKYQLDETGNNETWYNLTNNVGFDKFDVYIGVNSSEYSVSVAINNKQLLKIYAPFWAKIPSFFKSGNYVQDYRHGRYVTTHTYCLNVELHGNYTCLYTSQ